VAVLTYRLADAITCLLLRRQEVKEKTL
jgi:hypothetical protein